MTRLRAIAFTVVSCVAIASAHAGDAQKILALGTISDLKVRVYGNSAVVTGRAIQQGMENGKDYSGDYWFTRVYVKKDGSWKTVAWQTTLIQR